MSHRQKLKFCTRKSGLPENYSHGSNHSPILREARVVTFCVRGVISPPLANIYLNKLDRIWAARCGQLGEVVRYADDFVAMCQTESQAREALRPIGLVMDRLGLTLHPAKTRMVDLRGGKESFVFLGCTIRKKRSIQRAPDRYYMQRWPSPKAMKKLRGRVRKLTRKRQSGKDVGQNCCGTDPRASRLGELFPDSECRTGVQQDGRLGGVEFAALAVPARQATANQAPSIHWRSATRYGFASVDGHREIPGASHTKKIIGKPCAGKTARTV